MEINQVVFDQFPVLKTPRLTLRSLTIEDAKVIFQMRANQRINQFIARPEMREVSQAQELVNKCTKSFQDKQGIAWAGLLRDGQTTIGTCGFNSIDASNLHAEIGGELATEYWGKGIAQEAVEVIIQFGVETLNLHTIEAKVDPRNRGAIYLLKQLGFVKEAHYHQRIYYQDSFLDMAVYSLIKN